MHGSALVPFSASRGHDSVSTIRSNAFRDRWHFTGKEEDYQVGLVYMGARYYSPSLGVFISPDPLPLTTGKGDANVYAYVHGQTYKMVDPTGLDGETMMAPFVITKAGSDPASIQEPAGGWGKSSELQGESYDTERVGRAAVHATLDTVVTTALAATNPLLASWTGRSAADGLLPYRSGTTAGELTYGIHLASGWVMSVGAAFGAVSPVEVALEGAAEQGLARGSGHASGLAYANEVLSGGTERAFAGHGELRFGAGVTTVPEGTTLTMWTSHGQKIPDGMGALIEAGDYSAVVARYPSRVEGAASHLPERRSTTTP